MESIEKLTRLQNQIGYQKGDINTIALLGLFGEAGEVLNQTVLLSKDPFPEMAKESAVQMARVIENLKKQIRDNKMVVKVQVFFDPDETEKLDVEIADTLYYLNALAINRGKTLADYAEISYKKVSAKVQVSKDPLL